MNRPIVDTDRISRYIAERSKFSPTKGRVKTNAFVPPASRKMSVYHTQDLSETDVWGLGRDYVEPTLKKTILARADLSAVEYGKRNLTLVSNPIPHERHYDVVNWPDSEWLKVAADLADAAELVLRPGEPENVP